ncbi:MAG: VOC family protein [Alphaproteobacteria bacterium]|nr:VOC family protein [Alphaproteobacteria bacterium]
MVAVKAWHHTSLAVADLDWTVTFYCAAFGFRLAFDERGMTREIRSMTGRERLACDLAMLSSPHAGQMLELIAFRGGGKDLALPLAAGAGHIAFEGADLDKALGEVMRLGARPIGAVTSFPEGRATYCREPGGSFFELEELHDQSWAKG